VRAICNWVADARQFLGVIFNEFSLQGEEVTAMLFGLLPDHGNSHAPLTARIKSKDGSIVLVRIVDIEMVFHTAFGNNTRIQLSHIRRMVNIAQLQTLREISRLNRFRLHCIDENEIVGNLVSPVRLEVTILGVTQESGKVKVAEIDFLEMLPESFLPAASLT
jgi:hypothetical protein